jgi:RarD protein
MNRSHAGIAYIVLTAGCFATSDATVKHLGASLPVLVLLWSRYLFQTSVMAGLQARRRSWRHLLQSGHPRLQVLRASLLLGNSSCAFFGLQYLPLAEFTALVMMAPLASTLLAALVLGERVSPARWLLVGLGFAGMLVIVRPGGGALGWPALYAIGGALSFAAYQIVTQRLNAVDDLVTTNLLSGSLALLMLCLALLVLPIDLQPTLGQATPTQWLLLLLVGVAATSGQAFMVMAIRSAPLSLLGPFGYAQIAFAVLIGWALFQRTPDLPAVLGMVLIAAAGVATVWLNSREPTTA